MLDITNPTNGEFALQEYRLTSNLPNSGDLNWSMSLDPKLERRSLYGYIYMAPATDAYAWLEVDVILKLAGRELLKLPLNAYWKTPTVGGAYPPTRATALLSGGMADANSITLNLYDIYDASEVAVAGSDEANSPILQPLIITGNYDEARLSVSSFSNIVQGKPNRIIIASFATPI
jgi:hypothetical protein